MSAVIREIVNQSLSLANIISYGDSANGQDSQIAVSQLNQLLSSLNVDQLFPYSCKIVSYQFPTSKASYTIGLTPPTSTSDILADRPAFIERIMYFTGPQAQPLDLVQFALPDLLAHSRAGISTPRGFAVNPSYPYTEIFFDVSPSSGASIKILYNAVIPAVDINSVLEIPAEYNEVLITGLARKICITHSMPAELLQTVDILYKQALERVTTNNSRNQISTLDLYGPAFSSSMAENFFSYRGY